MLTGVLPDRRTGRMYEGNWTAIWRVETTRGVMFIHQKVPGTSGFGPDDRASVEFAALESPPREVVALVKARPMSVISTQGVGSDDVHISAQRGQA